MNTKVVRIKEEEKTRETLEKNPGLLEAAEILKNGGLVAFPTETVYGLGANALNEEAAKKIYAAKGRPSDNPLIAHISCMEELPAIVKEIPEAGRKLAEKYWPGSLPSKRTAPSPGVSMPFKIRNRVVFPAPDGPITETNSP